MTKKSPVCSACGNKGHIVYEGMGGTWIKELECCSDLTVDCHLCNLRRDIEQIKKDGWSV